MGDAITIMRRLLKSRLKIGKSLKVKKNKNKKITWIHREKTRETKIETSRTPLLSLVEFATPIDICNPKELTTAKILQIAK